MPTDDLTPAVALRLASVPSADRDVGSLRKELRALWLVEQVRLRRLGVGEAVELGGILRAAFLRVLGAHGVPVVDPQADDLDRELGGSATG